MYEALRGASDQRELHIVPVFSNGVIHDRPTLQQRLLLGVGWKHDAVGTLPYWDFADVADHQFAIAAAFSRDRHFAHVGGPSGSDER